MRKIAIILVSAVLLMFCAVPAVAEYGNSTISATADGVMGDFGYDGSEHTLHFGTTDGSSFTIAVDDQSFSVDCACELSGNVYSTPLYRGLTMDPAQRWATLFMVSEYGPSDDPLSYCYLFTDGILYDIGTIAALPEDMILTTGDQITTRVRARHIGTWCREADFVVASGFSWDDENYTCYYHICEVPRDLYSMGCIVTLKRDLPLKAARTDAETFQTLDANQQVIISATDDERWLYVTDLGGITAGWLEMQSIDYMDYLVVNGEYASVDTVFDGILYAD